MTASPEKAAPIPADVRKVATDLVRTMLNRFGISDAHIQSIGLTEDEIARAILADRTARPSAVEEPAPTRASLAVILDEVRRPSASLENHLRQIGVMIERMMEVAESERLRRDAP